MSRSRRKVVIFGLGSIGCRHIKLLKPYSQFDIYAFRSSRRFKRNKFGLNNIYTWEELDEIQPDIAFITNPTSLHIQTAIQCAKRKMALFIEKPLSHNMKGIDELLRIVRENRLPTYVAYVLRFHPLAKEIKHILKKRKVLHARILTTSYLPLWRRKGRHLNSYSAQSKFGGGVVLDLSHEIDLADYLFSGVKSMSGRFSRRGNVTVDAEDCADFLIRSGMAPVTIHTNFCSHIPQRVIQIDFVNESILADFISGKMIHYRRGKVARTRVWSKGMETAFNDQLKYFISNLKNQRAMNTVARAIVLFKKIHEFKENKKNT